MTAAGDSEEAAGLSLLPGLAYAPTPGSPARDLRASARGQATVIQAGRDVITGNVFVGQFARLRDRWLDPAPVFDDARVDEFTGRAWLLEPLDQFLAARDRGHVIVSAEAGLGKTALAARLAYSRGWPCHFTRGRNGSISTIALSNLGTQLIAQYQLAGQFTQQGILPETAGEPGWFEQVLRAAAERARAASSRLVIMVDGLDEVISAGPPCPAARKCAARPGLPGRAGHRRRRCQEPCS